MDYLSNLIYINPLINQCNQKMRSDDVPNYKVCQSVMVVKKYTQTSVSERLQIPTFWTRAIAKIQVYTADYSYLFNGIDFRSQNNPFSSGPSLDVAGPIILNGGRRGHIVAGVSRAAWNEHYKNGESGERE